jgi:hypothetical protein
MKLRVSAKPEHCDYDLEKQKRKGDEDYRAAAGPDQWQNMCADYREIFHHFGGENFGRGNQRCAFCDFEWKRHGYHALKVPVSNERRWYVDKGCYLSITNKVFKKVVDLQEPKKRFSVTKGGGGGGIDMFHIFYSKYFRLIIFADEHGNMI